MRKTILVLASVALAMVVLGGVAWAATIQCRANTKCFGTERSRSRSKAHRRAQSPGPGGVGCSVADRLEAIEVGGVQVEHLSHDGATGN
jgi:hypothetical protein